MGRLSFALILMLMVLLTASTLHAQDASGAPLRVVDSDPAPGEELSAQSPIMLYFNRPVNCTSAAGAFSIMPAVAGAVSCDDSKASLVFTPTEAYQRATTYTIQLATSLTAQDGTALGEAFVLELGSQGFLAVSDALPRDGSLEIATDAAITVIFNRPVVPLVTVEELATLPSPITLTPAAQGQGEWLNTSIYVFRPDPALAGGTRYTVTVNPDLQAVDGAALAAPVSWQFETISPAILTVFPEDLTTDVALDERVQVHFNQPMDQASVEANFYLRIQSSATDFVSGTFEWAEDGAGFRFIPDARLPINTVFEAGFRNTSAVLGAGGAAALGGFSQWQFATVPPPSILSTDPPNGTPDAYPYGSFTIYFASDMDIDSLRDKTRIDPKPWRDPDYYYSSWDDSYTVNFPVEPSTDYTITIAAGMQDIYGNSISEGQVIRYTTRAYDGEFSLEVPRDIGFYNAYADQTRLYMRYRNLNRMDFQLWQLPVGRLMDELAADRYYAPYNLLDKLSPDWGVLLRQWQIDLAPELNVENYELLQLSGQAANLECPGAPPSRLKVGDMAIVISDPDPVRARESAPDGAVIDQLYRDYQLPIVGGPVCADSIVWWEVRLRDDRTAWVAEALSGGAEDEYLLDVRIPAQAAEVVVSEAVGGGLAPGVYLLRVSAPERAAMGAGPTAHVLIVGTANLTMKSTVDNLLVWATDVQSGLPLANQPISVYAAGGLNAPIVSGVTDADGLMQVSLSRRADVFQPLFAVLQTETQFGFTSVDWSDGVEPYQFGQEMVYSPEPYRAYVYTDRPLYRPGQPVYFRGVVRAKDDVRYPLPDFASVPVRIYDPEGQILFENDLPLTAFGTFSGQFDLAENAPLGYYSITAELGRPDDQTDYYPPTGQVSFGVAEYRLPEFQVNVTPAADQVANGDTISVKIDSRYFFGGAVSGATVDYTVVAQPYYFSYDGPGYYDFFDYDVDAGLSGVFSGSGEVATGTGTTDAQGVLTVEIPGSLEDAAQSARFIIEAVVTDESQQVVAGRAEVIVHKGLLYIGAVPELYVGTAGEESVINLIAVDWESQGIANQSIDIEVVERRWSNVQEQDETGRTTWTWEVEEIPVTTGSAVTGVDGKTTYSFVPPNGGIFKVKIKTRDSQGSEIVAATTLWVSSESYVSWRQQNSNRIDLVTDKQDYLIGDTAEILIASPFQGTAEALVTVERDGVLKAERITLNSNSVIYRVPIEEGFAPNVFVSVLIVKGVDENNPVAAFRMGLARLNVETERKQLTISITPDREQAGPRETVTYTVRTTDYLGNPVQAEVGVGLTDLASLSIADPNSGPLLDFFYGRQGLAVRTSTPLTINVDQLTQTVLDTIKGGGGGVAEGGIFDIRQEFVDTAYWNATLVTGTDGTATFQVTLPDNLTTWRLDARAISSGVDGQMLVGQDTFDLISTKPLLIRPVTPRFLVVGDTVNLAAIVNNNTGQDMPVEVFIQGTGLDFQGQNNQTFTIPAGGRQRVEWAGVAQDVAGIALTFFANGDNGAFTDASKPPLGQGEARLLPVYKFEVPETVGTAGVLREGDSITESILLPRRFEVTQGSLNIVLEPSLASATLAGLDYLRAFPHECIEQTISRFLPNVMTVRALDRLGLANEALRQALEADVSKALQKLYAQQKADGGWGWFVQDPSSPLTTAYALIGLAEAEASGFPVADGVIESAQNFLRTTFIVPDQTQPVWRLNRQAFILYALARSGAPDASRSANLFEERQRLSLYARSFLALNFHLIDPADTSRTDALLSDLVNAAILSATGAHWQESEYDYWNWNTDTRTTAIALEALVTLAPQNNLVPNVVRWLMTARTADAWETTQETAWSVMALTDWMQVSGELQPDYQYSAALNGQALAEGAVTTANVSDRVELPVQVAALLKDQANQLVISRTEGSGVLYYTAHLKAYLPVPEVQPVNRGFILERRYTLPGSAEPE